MIMKDFNEFDYVFAFDPDYTYTSETIDKILSNRRTLDRELFLDKLLKVLHINQALKLYPPRSNHDLRTLHHKIISSSSPDHHKQSLLYYILKDCRAPEDAAASFSAKTFLPEKYEIYMKGLWHLDHLKFDSALEYLAQPSLIPTFPEEILQALLRHSVKGDPSLPLAYYHTVSPPLNNAKLLEDFFSYLCEIDVTEAFYFSRSQPANVHEHLLGQLILSILKSDKPSRADRAMQLINLPLNNEEEDFFEHFLLEGKGKDGPGAKDTMIMRRMIMGRFEEALRGSSQSYGKRLDGMDWNDMIDGMEHGLGPRYIEYPVFP